jgi:hypothetical protein
MGSDPCRAVNAPLDIHPEMHADPAADFFGLLHHPARHHTGSRIGRDDVERRARQRREGVEAEIAPQLNLSQIPLRILGWILAEGPPAPV